MDQRILIGYKKKFNQHASMQVDPAKKFSLISMSLETDLLTKFSLF